MHLQHQNNTSTATPLGIVPDDITCLETNGEFYPTNGNVRLRQRLYVEQGEPHVQPNSATLVRPIIDTTVARWIKPERFYDAIRAGLQRQKYGNCIIRL